MTTAPVRSSRTNRPSDLVAFALVYLAAMALVLAPDQFRAAFSPLPAPQAMKVSHVHLHP